jgi:endonuclease/exonuclease/phosphatase family metal-dependent hydrolase
MLMRLAGLSFVVALGTACALFACSSNPEPAAPIARANAPTYRIMSFNVNYGIAGDPETIQAIATQKADLVLLQETNPEWETGLRAELAADYPHIAFRHAGAAGGMGVLSKHAFQDLGQIDPPERGWFFSWRVRVSSPLGALQVLNVHLRPQIGDNGSVVSGYFTTGSVREREMEKYLAELEPGVATIVAGDFNEQPGGGALDYLLERGYSDVLDHAEGSRDTWRWNTSLGTLRREFDHIMLGKGLATLSAKVVGAGNSDHLPVVAVITPAE